MAIAQQQHDTGLSVVKSAARVLGILELFSERREPLSVGEVSISLGFPQSSTSMLLHSLEKLGYLEYMPGIRSFSPTVRVAVLGGWLNEALAPRGSLTGIMSDLHRDTGATVLLGLQRTKYVQYASVVPDGPARGSVRTGSLELLNRCALGKVLLANQSSASTNRLLRRINAETEHDRDRIDIKAFENELRLCRLRGYAVTRDDGSQGTACLAVELPIPTSQPRLAIGLHCLPDQLADASSALLKHLQAVVADFRLAFSH